MRREVSNSEDKDNTHRPHTSPAYYAPGAHVRTSGNCHAHTSDDKTGDRRLQKVTPYNVSLFESKPHNLPKRTTISRHRAVEMLLLAVVFPG